MSINDNRGWLALSRIEDLGPVTIIRLIDRFGSPEKIFGASVGNLSTVERVSRRIAERIVGFKAWDEIDRELEKAEKLGVRIACPADDDYPLLLAKTAAPPPILYIKGRFPPADNPAIAIVGSRSATPYGLKSSSILSRALADRGVSIISGAARGVDSAAHAAVLEVGGFTAAVLGCGIDVAYPPENDKLIARIAEQGAVISEFRLGARPDGKNFPRRNRIISGLSHGVLVVEAGKKSGALITARYALEQNREVFVVPGPITSENSSGTNQMLLEGAIPAIEAGQIIEQLGFTTEATLRGKPGEKTKGARQAKQLPVDLDETARKVYRLIGDEPVAIDSLIEASELPPNRVSSILLDLELKGLIAEQPGKKYVIE